MAKWPNHFFQSHSRVTTPKRAGQQPAETLVVTGISPRSLVLRLTSSVGTYFNVVNPVNKNHQKPLVGP